MVGRDFSGRGNKFRCYGSLLRTLNKFYDGEVWTEVLTAFKCSLLLQDNGEIILKVFKNKSFKTLIKIQNSDNGYEASRMENTFPKLITTSDRSPSTMAGKLETFICPDFLHYFPLRRLGRTKNTGKTVPERWRQWFRILFFPNGGRSQLNRNLRGK